MAAPERTRGRRSSGGSSAVKDRIRRKAAELFAKRGYHGTGIQELSDAVGLGRGALYHHIGSKETLLFEISTAHIHELIELGESLLAEDADATSKLRRLASAHMKVITDHRAEWTVFQRDAMALSGALRRQVIECRDRFEEIWQAIIAQGVESGEFRELDPVALKGILGMFNYAYMWASPRGRLSSDGIAEVFCDLVLEGLRR